MRTNCSNDREKLEILRSLEQFFLTVGQNNFGNKIPFSSDLAPIRAKLSLCTNGVGRDAVPSFEVRLRPDIVI